MVENELQQAIALIKAGNTSSAILILKSILKTNRNNELAWLWLSSCMDKPEDKIYCFREALRINPENDQTKRALEQLEPNPSPQPQMRNQMQQAIDAIKAGDKVLGRSILERGVQQQPKNELAWLWLSTCVEEDSQKIHCLTKVIEINPKNEKAINALQTLKRSTSEPNIQEILSNPGKEKLEKLSEQISNHVNHRGSVEFIPANCPNCGGELRVPADKNIVKCMYCGHDVIIHDPNNINVNVQYSVDISKHFKLALIAEEGKNYEDGYKYYSQVLENDSENIAAWLGKARCAAWRGTIQSQTLDEAVSYVKTALALGQPEKENINTTLSHIAAATSAYSILIGEFLTSEHDLKMEQIHTRAPHMISAAAVVWDAKISKEVSKKFINMYFPIIYRTLLFSWSTYPNKSVGASFYNTISNLR